MITRLRAWLKQRSERRYRAWLCKNNVVFVRPRNDDRDWSGAFMRSLKP